MKLVSGSSHPQLANGISQALQVPMVPTEISQFINGEKRVWIQGSVKGENVILVQSLSQPVDEHLMELLLLADALERAGARHVNMVIPWLGYSLQDKQFREGEPISAKVVANLISYSYSHRAFLLDLHNSSTPGFFSIPTQHLTALPTFVQYILDNFSETEYVVASPDFGGLKKARVFANMLEVDLVNIDKERDLKTGEITHVGLHGSVKDKTVMVYDDVINSGGTVVQAAELLKNHGAKAVHFFATHGLFANQGLSKMQDSAVDSVVITDSVFHPTVPDKVIVLDSAPIFAEALTSWA